MANLAGAAAISGQSRANLGPISGHRVRNLGKNRRVDAAQQARKNPIWKDNHVEQGTQQWLMLLLKTSAPATLRNVRIQKLLDDRDVFSATSTDHHAFTLVGKAFESRMRT
jgi:hypothetical protein